MEGTYEVTYDGQSVGNVTVAKQGLYYHFSCQCQLTKESIYRLIMKNDGREYDLGILTPLDRRFGMNTSISLKKVGTGTPEFYLFSKQQSALINLSPVSPDEPFSYISRLESAFLVNSKGKKSLVFRKEI